VSVVSYESNLSAPAIKLWNDTRHVKASNHKNANAEAQQKETSLWPQSQ
jgi:hypothetical protein